MIRFCFKVLLIIVLSVTSYLNVLGQEFKVAQKSKLVLQAIDKYHYEPRGIDDKFSAFLYEDLIENLDRRKLIFSSADIDALNEYKHTLDDEINNGDYEFINDISTLYDKRVKELISFLEEQKNLTYDFEKKDTIRFVKNRPFLPQKQIYNRFKKLIKFSVLRLYCAQLDTNIIHHVIDTDKLEKLKNDEVEGELCWLQKRLSYDNGIQKYVEDIFLKSLSNTFDPHTMYLSPAENDYFSSSLSKESLSFGIELYRNNRGELEIESLIPGGPAWNSNQLNEGDVITAIKGDADSKIELKCMPSKEAVNIIYSEDVKNVVFSIRKKSGKQVNVELQKAVIGVEENVIQSFVLNGDKKIGYIYLPSFYTNTSNGFYAQGCANDVAKALFNLKREGIEGLIFDIRNNGGGSMYEAINMAGIFINYGAISISDSKADGLVTIKDINRGTAFNKPLVVLQNQFSASASELFAAAMQDYNRGVIVGSHSYGKSTMQQIVPLCNDLDTLTENIGKDGFLKVTIGKFYRIDGTTHQKIGVQPDIRLANEFDLDSIGEVNASNALLNDTITKKVYAYPLPILPIGTLRLDSRERLKGNERFKKIFKNLDDKSDSIITVPIQGQCFIEYFVNAYKHEPEEYDDSSAYEVLSPDYLKRYGVGDNLGMPSMKKQIEKDMYVNESYHIINDLIHIK